MGLGGKMNYLNLELFRVINNLANKNELVDKIWIFIAVYSPVIFGCCFIIAWFYKNKQKKQRRTLLLLSIVSAVISEILAKIAGLLYYHPQPFVSLSNVNKLIHKSVDNAFPSDHSTVFFAVMIFLFISCGKKKYWYFPLIALIVGISRIWVGVHYPIDVIYGSFLGSASALIVYFIYRYFKEKKYNDKPTV